MVLQLNNIPTNSAENTLYKNNKRITSIFDDIITIGSAGAANLLAVGYPMGFNESTAKHTPWVAPDPSVLVVNMGATTPATAGTWGMTVNSLVIANTVFAYNATAAVVTEALRVAGYNATVDLTAAVYTITFDDPAQIKTIPTTLSGDVTQLTGATGEVATATTGTSTNGAQRIRGFINPNDVTAGVTSGTAPAVVLTGTDTVCTITSVNPHGLATGMSLTMSGATEAKLNITATITVTTPYAFTYTVAAVSGGTTETAVAYTTTNDVIATMMVKGDIHYDDIAALISTGDLTALQAALRADLVPDGLFIQGLTATR